MGGEQTGDKEKLCKEINEKDEASLKEMLDFILKAIGTAENFRKQYEQLCALNYILYSFEF